MTQRDLGLIEMPPPDGPSPAAAALDAFAVSRRDIAGQWAALAPSDVQSAHAGPLGQMHKLIYRSGLRDLPQSALDRAVIADLQAALATDREGPLHPGRLLAAMLFLPPHALPRFVELGMIPEWLWADYIPYALTPPGLFHALGEADAYADWAGRWISHLHDSLLPNLRQEAWRNYALLFLQHANFIPLYGNDRNLRDVFRKRAAIMEATLDVLNNPVDHAFGPRPDRRRLRVGILMADYTPRTETFATLPVYRHLDRSRFEILLYTMRQTNHAVEHFCAGNADAFVALPPELVGRVRTLRAADLDLIFVGGNVSAATSDLALLALHRLARIQIGSVCSCVTTGMRNMDYYLSGRLSEPTDAQAHYTEKLVMVDGPAHCYDFAGETPTAPVRRLSRAALDIAEDAVVFVSGANFHKIVPELEAAWMRILAAVPGSRLLLYPFNLNWSDAYPVDAFMARLATALAAHGLEPGRVLVFQAAPGRADILERLRLADIYLDSFPFSGATSLLDPLELALPMVIMDGVSFRTLVGPALLRTIELNQWIAGDADAYVALATKLAADPALRAATRADITARMQRRPKFIDAEWYGGQAGAAFEQIWRDHAD